MQPQKIALVKYNLEALKIWRNAQDNLMESYIAHKQQQENLSLQQMKAQNKEKQVCQNCQKSFVNLNRHKCKAVIIQQQQEEIISLPVVDSVIDFIEHEYVYEQSYIVKDNMFTNILKNIPQKFHDYITQILVKLQIDEQFVSYQDSIKIYQQVFQDLSVKYIGDVAVLPCQDVVKLFSLDYKQFKESSTINEQYTIVKNNQYFSKITLSQYFRNPKQPLCVDIILNLHGIKLRSFVPSSYIHDLQQNESPQKRQIMEKVQLQKQNNKLLIFQIEPLSGDRYIVALTKQEVIDLYNNREWCQKNTIHQVVSQMISKQTKFYMDLDKLENLKDYNISTEKFQDDLVNILNNVMRMYGQQYVNLTNGNNLFLLSTNYEKSIHVYLDFYVFVEDLQKLAAIIRSKFVNEFNYSPELMKSIIDIHPYTCATGINKYSTLRLDGFNKIKDFKIVEGKRLNVDVNIYNKIFMQDVSHIANNVCHLRNCIFIQEKHFNFSVDEEQESDDDNQEEKQIVEISDKSKKEFLAQLQITKETEKYVQHIGVCPIHKKKHKSANIIFVDNRKATCVKDFKSIWFAKYQNKNLELSYDQRVSKDLQNIQYQQKFQCNQNNKYVQFDVRQSHNTFVISHCGTGKTHQIAENIHQLLLENPKLSVLFISTRVSFSESIVTTLNTKHKINFQLYNEQKDLNNIQFLMIQVESMSRIIANKYDMVIVDEALSVFTQLNSIAGSKPWYHIKNLTQFLSTSTYNVFMDAFMTYPLYQFYLQLVPEKQNQIICNAYKPYQGISQYVISDPKKQEQLEDYQKEVDKYSALIEQNKDDEFAVNYYQSWLEKYEDKLFNLKYDDDTKMENKVIGGGWVFFVNKFKDQYKAFLENLTQHLQQNKKVFSIFNTLSSLSATVNHLIKYGILKKEQIMQIHGDNGRQDEETGEYHIAIKKEFYKDDDEKKHEIIQWVCYTKSLTVGVDSQVQDFQTGIHYLGSGSEIQYVNPFEVVQMLHRYRAVKTQYLYTPYFGELTKKDNRVYQNQFKYENNNNADYLYSPWYQQYQTMITTNQFYQSFNENTLHLQYTLVLECFKQQMKDQHFYIVAALLQDMGYAISYMKLEEEENLIRVTKAKADEQLIRIESQQEFDICKKIKLIGYNGLTKEDQMIDKLKGKYKMFKTLHHIEEKAGLGICVDQNFDDPRINLIQDYLQIVPDFVCQDSIRYQIPSYSVSKMFRQMDSEKRKNYDEFMLQFQDYISADILQTIYFTLTCQQFTFDDCQGQIQFNKILPLLLLYTTVYYNDVFMFDVINKDYILPQYKYIFCEKKRGLIFELNDIQPGARQRNDILKKCKLYFEVVRGMVNGKRARNYIIKPLDEQYEALRYLIKK